MSDPAGGGHPQTFFLKLHEDPLIYVIKSGWSLVSGLKLCLRDAAGKPFHLLVSPSWDNLTMAAALEVFARTVELMAPGSTVTVMCTGEEEVRVLGSRQVRTLHAHPNAFIDHRVFRPRPELARIYDAIYIGAMLPWKRHELAWGVANICVITYRHQPSDSAQVIRGYKHLAFTNLQPDGSVDELVPEAVAQLICQSRCGLILSAREGQNNASGEYQFCGIPTISTPSAGGRAEFFDGASTVIVEPVAAQVQRAVAFAVANPPDLQDIRRRVMEKAIRHRLRLIAWMSGLAGQNLQAMADETAWLPCFRDKLRVLVASD